MSNDDELLDIGVEYDSSGRSTGVEVEDENGTIDEPFDPALIDVTTRSMTVDLLLSRLRRGALDLAPDFQRKAGIWTDIAQSRLIESLLLRIPLPTLYAAEADDDWVVVDGIQRLTSIARFVAPEHLTTSDGKMEPLRLKGLDYLKTFDGKTYDELPGNLQTRIDETELVVHLIRLGTPEPVKFNIFTRINTGGRPLSKQELRHALIPGPARDLLVELASSSEFLDATGNSIRDDRMADREMVLRYLAFRLPRAEQRYRGDLDAFLRDAMQRVNDLTYAQRALLGSEFRGAMVAANRIFGEHAFRKRHRDTSKRFVVPRLPVNKALFEAVSVTLAELDPRRIERLVERRELVEEKFLRLMNNSDFMVAISVGTGDIEKMRRRFLRIRKLFDEVLT